MYLFLLRLQKERLKYQRECMESIKKLEAQLAVNQEKQGNAKVKIGIKDGSPHKKPNGEVYKSIYLKETTGLPITC